MRGPRWPGGDPLRDDGAMRNLGALLLRASLSLLGGAVAMILVGQLFALTRSTCDTLCRPENAARYGLLGGAFFFGLREWDRQKLRERREAEEEEEQLRRQYPPSALP